MFVRILPVVYFLWGTSWSPFVYAQWLSLPTFVAPLVSARFGFGGTCLGFSNSESLFHFDREEF